MKKTFHCPSCGQKVLVEAEKAGRKISCPHCSTSVVIPREDIVPGRVIGGFELRERLGVGGMGEVWLAYQSTMDRQVAVKILSPALTHDLEFVENFLEEVRIAAKMDHNNIVTAFDAGVDDHIYYLAMSFIPGETLAEKIDREGKIDETTALSIVYQVAQALHYAWEKFSILHRDINPSNMMLTPDGEVKLMDMGISKSLADQSGIIERDLVGTPEYMSPEQAEGLADIDVRADIYSLGATLFQMLTGEVPFSGSDPHEILQKQLDEPLPSPRSINPSLSYRATVLVETMVAKDRGQRPATWSAVLKDLRSVMGGRYPLTPHPVHGVIKPSIARGSTAPPVDKRKLTVSSRQIKKTHDDHRHLHPSGKRQKSMILHMLLVALLLVAGIFIFIKILSAPKQPRTHHVSTDITPKPDEDKKPAEAKDEEALGAAREAWELAALFAEQNPQRYDQALRYFETVLERGAGTEYEQRAEEQIRRLQYERYEAIQQVMSTLKAQADELVEKGELEEAVNLLLEYDGSMQRQTADLRAEKAEAIATQIRQLAAQRRQRAEQIEASIATFLNQIANELLGGNIRSAINLSAEFIEDNTEPEQQEVAGEVREILANVARMDQILLESFADDIGKEIELRVDDTNYVLRIQRVQDEVIVAERRVGPGYATIRFSLRQIPFSERYRRLENRADPKALALYAGISNFRRNQTGVAESFFRNTGHLAAPLIRRMNSIINTREREDIEQKLLELVHIAGAENPELSWDAVLAQLLENMPSPRRAQHVLNGLDTVIERYSDHEWLADKPFIEDFRSFLRAAAMDD